MKKEIKDENQNQIENKDKVIDNKISRANIYELGRKTNLYLIPNPNRSIGKWLHKTNCTKRPPKARVKGR